MKKVLLPFACALCAVAMNAQNATLVSSTPVTVSAGFNADVVAEDPYSETTDKATYPAMDSNHACFLVVDGIEFSEGQGLPEDGKITTSANHVYQFGDYTKNNALFLKDTETGTLTLSNVAAGTTHLGIMCLGANFGYDEGRAYCTGKINYTDGTSTDIEKTELKEWSDNNGAVFHVTARFVAHNNWAASNYIHTNCNFYIHEIVLPVDPAKTVASVEFTNVSGHINAWGDPMLNYFAVSALVMQTSGIDAVAAENAEVVAIYNIAGVKVNDFVKGVNVVKYSDGKVRKIFVNK